MIFALQNHKLGKDYSLAHDRGEDLLTSTVFQLLRYIPTADAMVPILRRARPIRCDWKIPDVDEFEVALWPRLGEGCCPDLIIRLKRKSRVIASILIEAKLYAGMSNRSDGENSDEESDAIDEVESIDRKQLVRYWDNFHQSCDEQGLDHWMIYLTAHLSAPQKELDACWRPEMRLAWLSWYDIHAVVVGLPGLPASDLATILAEMGFATFNGFRERVPIDSAFGTGRFFGRHEYFTSQPSLLPVNGRFWSRS